MFGDSVEANIETVKELLQGMPPSARGRAKQAAVAIEKAVMGARMENPKDPAIALGVAFALFSFAQRIVQGDASDEGSGERLIQLLS